MPEPLSLRDFNAYYSGTFLKYKDRTYYVRSVNSEDNTIILSTGNSLDQHLVVKMNDILDYVGKYPPAGYRQFSDYSVQYVVFRRDGQRKGPSTSGIVMKNAPDCWYMQLFSEKFYDAATAVERAVKGLPSALSYDVAVFPSNNKMLLYWKDYIVGRMTKNGKAILSTEYEWLKNIITEVSVGDIR